MDAGTRSRWPKLAGLQQIDRLASHTFAVPAFDWFSAHEWRRARDKCLLKVAQLRPGRRVAIRSCAMDEDAIGTPGQFRTVLRTPSADAAAVEEAVEIVLASYSRAGRQPREDDFVLVQEQVEDALFSGVCLVTDARDFIEAEYVAQSGSTDDVTSGKLAHRIRINPFAHGAGSVWGRLGEAAAAISREVSCPVLIEFAIDSNVQVLILQVRAYPTPGVKNRRAPSLAELQEVGDDEFPLSSMTDWNPVEILGPLPAPLSVSVYQDLVTHEAWRRGRESLGWRAAGDGKALLRTVFGKPYVRVRESLESLLPASLPAGVVEQLLLDRIQFLERNPDLHDKVEFRVVPSSATGSPLEFIKRYHLEGLDRACADMYFQHLMELTARCFAQASATRTSDLSGFAALRAASRDLLSLDVNQASPAQLLQLARNAKDVCIVRGTIPFSRQARLAFMFRHALDYLLEGSQDTREYVEAWATNLPTPAAAFEHALRNIVRGTISRDAALAEFGHVRPLAYSVSSRRLDEDPDLFESMLTKAAPRQRVAGRGISLPPTLRARCDDFLMSLALDWTADRFMNECGDAFSAREQIKFEFTRLTSALLHLVSRWADSKGLALEDVAKCTWTELELALGSGDDAPALRRRFADIAQRSDVRRWVDEECLPDVAFNHTDFMFVSDADPSPTFVGADAVRGPVLVLERNAPALGHCLTGCIVVAESADPGIDWIFTQGIAGLVTRHGGRFSHMTLRSEQAGVTAAIGCGDRLFRQAASASVVELRPREQQLLVFDGQRHDEGGTEAWIR